MLWLLPFRCAIVAAGLFFFTSLSLHAAELELDISGVKDELKDNIQAYLGIASIANEDKNKAKEAEIRRLHLRAPAEIQSALQPFGYYDASVTSSLTKKAKVWQARYKIDKGPVTRLDKVNIQIEGEGKDQARIKRLVKIANIKPGQNLQHEKYKTLKSGLLDTAYGMGYLDAKFKRSRIGVRPEKLLADIELVFDTGPRYFFGDITIEQDILRPDFVDKFVQVKSNEPFETQRLIDLQLDLSDSDYFRQVELNAEKDKARDNHVPVTVRARAGKSQKYEASVGYGTDTGPRLGLSTLFRRVNRRGHQWRNDLRLSAVKSTLASQYKIPVGDVASEFLDFTANADQRYINDVEATNYGIGSSLNQNRWGGRRRLSLAFEHESWAFGDLNRRSATHLIPAINYNRKVADDPLFTRRGYSVNLTLLGSAENVLADTTFIQAHVSGRAVLPLGAKGRFLLRAEYGATETDDFIDLPPSKRFFAGGAGSVRGYGYEEISPRDAQRNLIGGQYIATASVEADYLFWGNFGLAVFYDVGNVADDPNMDLLAGAGIGFRYRSPVGMIRLDLAHPFDDPDSSFAFHISIGPDLQ